MEEIKRKSHKIILELLPNATDETLTEDVDIFSLGLDSINAMSLVMNLQEAFGIEFEASEISPENFRTVTDIATLIVQKL